jgi:hypothetical protein
MSIFEPIPKPNAREMAYLSYVKYCEGLGQQAMAFEDYEVVTASLQYANMPGVGRMGQA